MNKLFILSFIFDIFVKMFLFVRSEGYARRGSISGPKTSF